MNIQVIHRAFPKNNTKNSQLQTTEQKQSTKAEKKINKHKFCFIKHMFFQNNINQMCIILSQ